MTGRYFGPINTQRIWNPNYGDGSDASPDSYSFIVTDSGHGQTYQWVNFTLNNGHTITLSETHKPSIFRCQGTLTINGAIGGNNKGWAGGSAGLTIDNSAGWSGLGPGRGAGGNIQGGGGGGAGHAAAGTTGGGAGSCAGVGGSPYSELGALLQQSYESGSVGSGGGAGGRITTDSGAGGYGGGGLVIVARRFVLGSTASITLNGQNGSNATDGSGGGGSGGLFLVIADTIQSLAAGAVITATAGSGGTVGVAGRAGGAGAVGRIYWCYLRSVTPAAITGHSDPAGTVIRLLATISIG